MHSHALIQNSNSGTSALLSHPLFFMEVSTDRKEADHGQPIMVSITEEVLLMVSITKEEVIGRF